MLMFWKTSSRLADCSAPPPPRESCWRLIVLLCIRSFNAPLLVSVETGALRRSSPTNKVPWREGSLVCGPLCSSQISRAPLFKPMSFQNTNFLHPLPNTMQGHPPISWKMVAKHGSELKIKHSKANIAHFSDKRIITTHIGLP